MQKRMARRNGSQIRPVMRMIRQFLAAWIVQNVEAGFFKRPAQPVFVPQHAVVRLFLKLKFNSAPGTHRQFQGKMFAKKLHRIALVAVHAHSHPDQVKMVWHEDVSRAEQPLAGGGMKQQFAEMQMESFIQPAGGAAFQCDRPLHHGKSTIKLRR